MVEIGGLVDVSDIEMHVADDCADRHSFPFPALCRCYQILNIERLRCHLDLVVDGRPRGAIAVGIYLDSKPIGIGEVNRLTDQMVRHPGVRTDVGEMLDKCTKGRSVRQKYREVIEAEQPSSGYSPRVLALIELNENAILAVRSELSTIGGPVDHSHADDCLVIRNGALEVCDLEANPAYAGLFRQPVARRPDSIALCHCFPLVMVTLYNSCFHDYCTSRECETGLEKTNRARCHPRAVCSKQLIASAWRVPALQA